MRRTNLPAFRSWCKNGTTDFGPYRPGRPVDDLTDIKVGDIFFVEDNDWNALDLCEITRVDLANDIAHARPVDPHKYANGKLQTTYPDEFAFTLSWDVTFYDSNPPVRAKSLYKAHDTRQEPWPTMTVSWVDIARSPRTRHTVDNVAWWRDENSPYDPYVLRVLYDQNARKLGGPIVREMTEWSVKPNGPALAASTEPDVSDADTSSNLDPGMHL